MPKPKLPQDVLNTLFSPSSMYSDMGTALVSDNPKELDFEEMASEILGHLEYDTQLTGLDESELYYVSATVSIEHKANKSAIDAIKAIGDISVEQHQKVYDRTLENLKHDFNSILGPLDSSDMKPLRNTLNVQDLWIDAFGALRAFRELIREVTLHRTPEWWEWFMSGGRPPSLHGPEGVEGAISLVSRNYLNIPSHPYSERISKPWLDWALQGKGWKDLGLMHGWWLASELKDPQKRLARELDDKGFKFDINKVEWIETIRHARGLSDEKPIQFRDVEVFLDKHLAQIVRQFPESANNAYIPNLKDTHYPSKYAVNLSPSKGAGIAGLIDNVVAPDKRKEMMSQVEGIRIGLATPLKNPSTRSGPRL